VFKGIAKLIAESTGVWEIVKCVRGVQVKRLRRGGGCIWT
jgi:hypothetical protein